MSNIVYIIIGKTFKVIDILSNLDKGLHTKYIICSTDLGVVKKYFLEKYSNDTLIGCFNSNMRNIIKNYDEAKIYNSVKFSKSILDKIYLSNNSKPIIILCVQKKYINFIPINMLKIDYPLLKIVYYEN